MTLRLFFDSGDYTQAMRLVSPWLSHVACQLILFLRGSTAQRPSPPPSDSSQKKVSFSAFALQLIYHAVKSTVPESEM
jgi:hypothetical protein